MGSWRDPLSAAAAFARAPRVTATLDFGGVSAARPWRFALSESRGYIGQSWRPERCGPGFADTRDNDVAGALFDHPGAFANRFGPLGRPIVAAADSDVPLLLFAVLRDGAGGLSLAAAGALPPAGMTATSRPTVSTERAGAVATLELELEPAIARLPGFGAAEIGDPSTLPLDFLLALSASALAEIDGATMLFAEDAA